MLNEERKYVTNRPLVVVIIACTLHTEHYQGASLNNINNPHIEYAKFRSREVSHMDWVHWCIV